MLSLKDFLIYPASVTVEDGVFCLRVKTTSPNVGINAEGATLEEAAAEAKDVILSIAMVCIAENEPAPAAAGFAGGDLALQMTTDFALKCMLQNAMLERGISAAELARLLGSESTEQVRELLNFEHATALDRLYPAFAAVGRPLQVSC